MDIYDKLGVTKIINASGFKTAAGGSLMPESVLKAMDEAARHYVPLTELQDAAGRRIAEITHNEAAYISCGAAGGLTVAAAACMTRGVPAEIGRLPHVERNEIIIQRNHRNVYDLTVRAAGASVVEIGFATSTQPWHLESAITPRTAAVYYFIYTGGYQIRAGSLPIEQVVQMAHARGVPVVLDAASQVPPIDTLWKYTHIGVDLVVVSGGKGIRGPQGTGLILGRKDLIEACKVVGPPNSTPLRGMKVAKEEMAGLVAAVEWALARDETALANYCEDVVKNIVKTVGDLTGVSIARAFPADAGQPFATAVMRFTSPDGAEKRREAIKLLKAGSPSIVVAPSDLDGVRFNPLTVEPDEVGVVASRAREVALALAAGS